MLTVRAALQLPVFETARIVGGAGGLERVVERALVVDSPGTDFGPWANGLLLLTAGYGMRHNRTLQAEFVSALARQGVAGVIFATGWYFDEVPQAICQSADDHGLPIVAIDSQVGFIAILERLYAELLNEQFALDRRVDEVHERLIRLVLEGEGIGPLASALAGVLGRSVLIEDASNNVLAAARNGPADLLFERAERAGRTPDDALAVLTRLGLYAGLQTGMRQSRVGPLLEVGLSLERVVAPIIAGREPYGYIWILAGDRPLARLDERAAETAATVAALALLKERAVQEAQQALRGDFLAQLLRGGVSDGVDPTLNDLGQRLGFRLGARHQFLYLIGQTAEEGGSAVLAAQIEGWLHQTGLWGLVAIRDAGLAVMLESDEDGVGTDVARKFLEAFRRPGRSLVIGVGRGAPDVQRARAAYDEAREAAEIGLRLDATSRVVAFWDLGVLHWLARLPETVVLANPYIEHVAALERQDQRTHGELVATLEVFLDHGGALAQASDRLGVHRNTLLYRIDKIEQTLGVDLKDASTRLNLHVAVKAFRLNRARFGGI